MGREVKTFEDYVDILWNTGFYDEIMDDMFWRDHFDSDVLFELTKEQAFDANIDLIDVNECDYDKYFWDLYNAMEKGLS